MSYNGWSNRETWNVSLWLNNDEGTYRELQALVRRARSVEALAESIRELCAAIWPDGKTPDGERLDEADFNEVAAAEWSEREEPSPESHGHQELSGVNKVNAEPGSIASFIAKCNLGFEAHRVASRPDALMTDSARHFRCVITSEGRERHGNQELRGPKEVPARLEVYFSQGSAHTEPPTLADVLDCLASDASGYDQAAGSFEEWASDLGYDADSRKAEKTFRAVEKQARDLKALLGAEAYEELLYQTERL